LESGDLGQTEETSQHLFGGTEDIGASKVDVPGEIPKEYLLVQVRRHNATQNIQIIKKCK
jgi:hypothetical protein